MAKSVRHRDDEEEENGTGSGSTHTPSPSLRGSTLILTNLIKLAGLLIALNELVIRPEPRSVGLAVAAFMMAGAQVSEEVLVGFIDSFLGRRNGAKGSGK